MDARRTPGGILCDHLEDQFTDTSTRFPSITGLRPTTTVGFLPTTIFEKNEVSKMDPECYSSHGFPSPDGIIA